jgi:hypothetical protein
MNPAVNAPGRAAKAPAGRKAGLEFALLNGFFDGIGYQAVVPFIAKGVFRPDYRFQHRFKVILTGFADVAVREVEIIPARYGLLYGMSAHITSKGFHGILLVYIQI